MSLYLYLTKELRYRNLISPAFGPAPTAHRLPSYVRHGTQSTTSMQQRSAAPAFFFFL
jgi:hypothetical protein